MKGYCQQKHSGEITEFYPKTFLTKISWKQRFTGFTKEVCIELISENTSGEREFVAFTHCEEVIAQRLHLVWSVVCPLLENYKCMNIGTNIVRTETLRNSTFEINIILRVIV